MKNRFLLIIMISIMLINVSTFADSFEQITDFGYQKEFKILSKLKFLDEDENLLKNTITRAEFCELTIKTMRCEEASNQHENDNIFEDVAPDSKYSKYINFAHFSNIANGVGSNRFEPTDKITYEQAITFVIRALNYKMDAEVLGGFPSGYMEKADSLKLTNGINIDSLKQNEAIGYEIAAKLIFNSLKIPIGNEIDENSLNYITIDPNFLISKNNQGYAEFYDKENDKIDKIKVSDNLKVYNNLAVGTLDDIKEAKAGITTECEYRYADFDCDGIYEVVFVKNVESHIVGAINYKKNILFDFIHSNEIITLKSNENEDFLLTSDNHEPIDISDVKYAQIVNIKKSVFGDFTLYELYISGNHIGEYGSITEVNTIYNIASGKDETYYKINGKDYQFYPHFNQAYTDRYLKVNEEIEFFPAENGKIIVFFIALYHTRTALVIDLRKKNAETYTLKMIFDDGIIREKNFSKELLNTEYTKNFFEYFKKGTLVEYYSNTYDEITEIQNSKNIGKLYPNTYAGKEDGVMELSISGTYDAKTQTLGNKYELSNYYSIFLCETNPDRINENNVNLILAEDLVDKKFYRGTAIASQDYGSIYSIVLYEN